MKVFLTYIILFTCHCLSAQKELKRENHEEFKLSDVNDSLHVKTATYTWLVRPTYSNVKHYQLRLYYDQNGKITKGEHSTKRNRETTSTEFYVYDSLAQLVQVKRTVRASDLDSLLFQTDYVYGLNSKTEIYQDFTDTVPNTRTTKYFFDEFGNVHLDSIFYNGEFTNRISRTFVYDSLGRIKLDNSYLDAKFGELFSNYSQNNKNIC